MFDIMHKNPACGYYSGAGANKFLISIFLSLTPSLAMAHGGLGTDQVLLNFWIIFGAHCAGVFVLAYFINWFSIAAHLVITVLMFAVFIYGGLFLDAAIIIGMKINYRFFVTAYIFLLVLPFVFSIYISRLIFKARGLD